MIGARAGWLLAHGAVRLTSTTVNTLYVATAARVPALGWQDARCHVAGGVVLALRRGRGARARGGPGHSARRRSEAPIASSPATVPALGMLGARARAAADRRACVRGWARSTACRSSASRAAVARCLRFRLPRAAALVVLSRVRRPTASRALFGVEGALAHANLSGAIPRVAVSVAALAVALSMMVAIAIMIGSFRETVIYWVGQTLQADLYHRRPPAAPASTRSRRSRPSSSARSRASSRGCGRSLPQLNLVYDGRLTVLGTGDFRVLLAHGNLALQGTHRWLCGDPRRHRPRCRPRVGGLCDQGRAPRWRHGVAADAAWARPLSPGGCLLRLHDRPRGRRDGSRNLRTALRRSAADQPDRCTSGPAAIPIAVRDDLMAAPRRAASHLHSHES